jgi:prolyl-tRNA synthetase
MAMPVIKGVKSANERFAGAEETFTIEALMQDKKALQAGTSHFLGQNFARAFDVKYLTDQNKEEFVWATSWGVSTRLVGGLIMTHSDDDGLVLPPALAPYQVVIVPIPKPLPEIMEKAEEIKRALEAKGIDVLIDKDTKKRPGFKFAEYEMKGFPVRLGLGKRDLAQNMIEIARRDTKEKVSVPIDSCAQYIATLLGDIQDNLFQRAVDFREEYTTQVDDFESFKTVLKEKGGFISAHWDGSTESEIKIKELTKATIRCIPLDSKLEEGKCVLSGRPSKQRVLFAKAY